MELRWSIHFPKDKVVLQIVDNIQQYMSNYDDDDGIIEAEIVDKDTKYW